jgi:hypothetical protein
MATNLTGDFEAVVQVSIKQKPDTLSRVGVQEVLPPAASNDLYLVARIEVL